MKTKLLSITIAIGLAINCFSQTSDRDYIADRIRIYYIPHPNTPPLEVIRIPVSRVLGSGFIFGTGSENGMDICARFLKHLLRPIGRGADDGQPLLQQNVANTLHITGDSVVVDIYHDDQALNAYAKTQYLGDPNYQDDHVWPSAWREDIHPAATGAEHTGHIRFGENYASGYGITEMRRTFVHEIMHTQDFADVRYHVWGRARYGADGDHYSNEMLPNAADAFKEGQANSMTFIYSRITRNQAISWFANNDYCVIEMPPADGVITRDHLPARTQWIYTQVSSTDPPGPGSVFADGSAPTYRVYRIAELPSRFIMMNEQIIGMIGAEYALKIGRAKYFQAIRSGNGRIFRVSTAASARWMEALSNTAIPDGVTMNDIRTTSRPSMPYLFALALADYFTFYRSTSVAQFKAMFENSLSDDWANLYWTVGKDIVRRAAPIALSGGRPPVLNVQQNIDAIAAALGVSTP
jgi:hypothetical protein